MSFARASPARMLWALGAPRALRGALFSLDRAAGGSVREYCSCAAQVLDAVEDEVGVGCPKDGAEVPASKPKQGRQCFIEDEPMR